MKQTAIITGASRGIGAAIALELAANDIHTILLARDGGKLKEVADKISSTNGSCTYHLCNVTNSSDIEKIVNAEKQRLVDSKIILINNAGYGGTFQRTDEMTEEEWDLIFNTNIKAAFLFCKNVLPMMKENNWGRIINIASIYGSVGGALSSAYAASKHALVGYTKSLSAEWGKYNITCNSISPGFTNTNMGAGDNEVFYKNVISQIPLKRQGEPEEIAKLVSFLSKEDAGYINGADILIDGGLLAGRSFW